MTPEIMDRLRALAQSPILLVASDYDGTLAPIVGEPAAALPDQRAVAALRRLAALPHTPTAVISGRTLADLNRFLGEWPDGVFVGTHGAEWRNPGVPLTGPQRHLLAQLWSQISRATRDNPGLTAEFKPAGVALHYRNADPLVAQAVVTAVTNALSALPGVYVKHGSMVVEFLVLEANKGHALTRVRQATGATSVIFIGDDLTDEDAFASLGPHDLGIKIGDSETHASARLPEVAQVATILDSLADLRSNWVQSRGLVPLDRCAILSDQRTIAVLTPRSTIAWLCLPSLDSSALFASLVGGPSAGYFSIETAGAADPSRVAYHEDSFVLVTEWPGLRVTDYLDCSAGRAFQRAGRTDLIRVIEGTADAVIRFAPRLDFGRVPTRLKVHADGLVIDGSPDPVCLFSRGVPWRLVDDGPHHTAEAIAHPAAGPLVLELRYGSANLRPAAVSESVRQDQNRRFWSGWARSLQLPGLVPDLVRRSALVIKALCYGPTGAIAAAATTSLPELLGGQRNWDYRFCWPRDGALAAAALVRLGNTGHALKFLDWVLEVVDRCETPDRLRPIYTLAGGPLPPEADLAHLCGFGDSRPVRISNAAASQVQLDVFGPITDLVALLAERGAPISPDHWRLVRAMARAVESRWAEPDHGIWEMRIERRHHVHSKVMCWHTIKRALVVEDAVFGSQNADWSTLRDAIRQDVLANAWNEQLGAVSGAYGQPYLDAAALQIGLTGLLPHDDPRWSATVDRIGQSLRTGPTVRRYLIDDGLPGDEGGLHLCTGWLIESLISLGRHDEARQLFDQFASLMREPGILTEEFDPRHGMALGNLAQAYSHLALINAALAIDGSTKPPAPGT